MVVLVLRDLVVVFGVAEERKEESERMKEEGGSLIFVGFRVK